MLIRFFERKFKRQMPALSYFPAVYGIFMCYLVLSEHRVGNAAANVIMLSVTSVSLLVGITFSLRRFIGTLQKPYDRSNIHVALGSVFATVILFAGIYSALYLYIPGSFAGLGGNSPLDECVSVIYFSAVTFTTVGFGDITPVVPVAKAFVTVEVMSFFVFFVVLLGNHGVFIKPKER
ncbi:MAG: ion channel [Firmicutes bacterium]|nr:ion channel [Bacillota bacterium]